MTTGESLFCQGAEKVRKGHTGWIKATRTSIKRRRRCFNGHYLLAKVDISVQGYDSEWVKSAEASRRDINRL